MVEWNWIDYLSRVDSWIDIVSICGTLGGCIWILKDSFDRIAEEVRNDKQQG